MSECELKETKNKNAVEKYQEDLEKSVPFDDKANSEYAEDELASSKVYDLDSEAVKTANKEHSISSIILWRKCYEETC